MLELHTKSHTKFKKCIKVYWISYAIIQNTHVYTEENKKNKFVVFFFWFFFKIKLKKLRKRSLLKK